MRGPGVRQDEGIPTLAGPGEQWGPSRALVRLHNARESTGAGRRAPSGRSGRGIGPARLVGAHRRLHNGGGGGRHPAGGAACSGGPQPSSRPRLWAHGRGAAR